LIDGQSAGKSFAYILGVYLGDGCITRPKNRPTISYVFRLEVFDEDFAIATQKALDELECKAYFRKNYRTRYKQGYSFVVETRDKELTEALRKDTRCKEIIPSYVYKWNKENKIAFISGVMDSEGFVSKRTKPLANGLPSFMMGIKMDYNILKQFKPILQSVGIKTGKFTMTKPKWVTNIQTANLTINIPSWIEAGGYFHIQRKKSRVEQYINNTNLNDYMPDMQVKAC
jgi:DNA-binding transcriptional regulator WhiA